MGKRGRPTNEERAARAERMAQQDSQADQPVLESVEPEYGRTEPHDDTPPPPPRNEPRRLAMEEIYQRDLKTKGMEPEPILEAPKEETSKEETPKEEVKAEEDPKAAAPVIEPPKTVRVKVDGEEFDAPAAEVEAAGGVTAYQKDRAAENRLKKANEHLAQTRQTEAQIRQTQAQIAAWIQQQQDRNKPPVQSDDEFIQSRIQMINFGTPEEQAQASRELREKLSPRVDQNAIVRQAITAMQQEQAENQFVTEFSDIVHNPLLLKLILQMKHERLSQIQGTPDWGNFYRSIGNEVRGAIGRQSQPASSQKAPDHTSLVDKEARKASIVNLPTAAARPEFPKEEKPETRADILKQMRLSRGIPTG